MQWIKNGVYWLGLVVFGTFLVIMGTPNSQDDPVKCGGETMRPGDKCVSSKGGSRTYDEVKAHDTSHNYYLYGFGGLLILGGAAWAVSDINDGRRARRPAPPAPVHDTTGLPPLYPGTPPPPPGASGPPQQ